MFRSKPVIAFAITALLSACQSIPKSSTNDITSAKVVVYHKGEPQSPHDQIVLVGGCFDVLHYGHIQFLEKAKAQGNFLIVALEPDSAITKYKKRDPLHTQAQRAFNIASLHCVDRVLLLPPMKGFEDYNQLVVDVKPNVIAITSNDPQLLNKRRQAEGIGARLIPVIERMDGFSSSKIIQALSD